MGTRERHVITVLPCVVRHAHLRLSTGCLTVLTRAFLGLELGSPRPDSCSFTTQWPSFSETSDATNSGTKHLGRAEVPTPNVTARMVATFPGGLPHSQSRHGRLPFDLATESNTRITPRPGV